MRVRREGWGCRKELRRVAGSCFLIATVALLLPVAALCQERLAEGGLSPHDLVRAMVTNELKPENNCQTRWMYRKERDVEGRKTAKEVVQTPQGSLYRLIAQDGQPLSPQEKAQEQERLEKLIRDSGEQKRLERANKKEAERYRSFLQLLPDALLFSYVGREGNVIKLRYEPNPNFQPPTREARVFHAMEGELWIQAREQRLMRIRGEIIADVKFAGGLLGRLDKGGRFNFEQAEIAPGQWEMTHMQVDLKGTALLFKSIAVQQSEWRSDFRPVPGALTLAQAATMLAGQVMVAENR